MELPKMTEGTKKVRVFWSTHILLSLHHPMQLIFNLNQVICFPSFACMHLLIRGEWFCEQCKGVAMGNSPYAPVIWNPRTPPPLWALAGDWGAFISDTLHVSSPVDGNSLEVTVFASTNGRISGAVTPWSAVRLPEDENSSLWKRMIAWEWSRGASGYGIIWGDVDQNKHGGI